MATAATKDSSLESQIRANSPRSGSGKTVHPVDIETQAPPQGAQTETTTAPAVPNPVLYQETKQGKKWNSWLIPCFVIANIIVFVITMYVNDCPKNSVSCVARSLGRFSFQPFSENPLLGPSSNT